MIQKASSAFRPRVVLDTNVCLDLFMFRDPRWQTLMDALTGGEIAALTREDCRRELELVLAYERMKLSAAMQAAILAEFDQLISLHTGVPDAGADMPLTALPVCKDSDDQKFLELALACEADVLITKDKALLKLARKTARNGQFRILSPEGWLGWYAELRCAPMG
jgi:putative PIN family toxin of toxin-antitoxin system